MYLPDGEIDWYYLWAQSQRRIYELEQRIEAIRAEAIRRIGA
jgi:tetrahydromethanopterin S-methyltransferase subunit G